ncbi:MAG: LytTR family transcriptional regulator [Clostridia bacterium]|nr:LytTR family transcriptional regulator [Clostridia bacterium]
MKFRLIIDKNRDEEILVYAHSKSALVEAVERLVSEEEFRLIGYIDREAVRLDFKEICRFVVEDNRVFAETAEEKYRLKFRLREIEEKMSADFVKINQSCLANINMVKRFDASVSGSLLVKFKNGSTDYVSRRQLKTVKERFGL